jgi:hypothetical protein
LFSRQSCFTLFGRIVSSLSNHGIRPAADVRHHADAVSARLAIILAGFILAG